MNTITNVELDRCLKQCLVEVEQVTCGDEAAPCKSLLGRLDDDDQRTGERDVPEEGMADSSGSDGERRKLWVKVIIQLLKVVLLLGLLYLFICSLDLLGSAFRLLGGKAAGATFSDSKLLQNPIAGLMIGVLATVLVQSSSTSTSIVVTMVASGIMTVQPAIPIIMGANIGTSLTNTIVSLAQSSNRDEFRRSFAGATVHDMFNWLTVIVLLPIEIATGYLYHVTNAIVSTLNTNTSLSSGMGANKDMLKTITKPITEFIVQLDKNVIEGIATGHAEHAERSLLKQGCAHTVESTLQNVTSLFNVSSATGNVTAVVLRNVTQEMEVNVTIPTKSCVYMFEYSGLSDAAVGGILLIFSLLLLCLSLIFMVKILNSALRGKVLKAVKKTVNAELPGRAAYFTGYVVMVIGAILTMLVQSSSVFTSVLTPLVGVGVVKIERMYPLTLGSNIGTTTTGIIAALAASSDQLKPALQIAFCHLLFNLSGILLFYPIPCLRFPVGLAKLMGKTTAKYRWFAILYVIAMFFAIPLSVFALSWAGNVVMTCVVVIVLAVVAVIVVVNVTQRRRPNWLPKKLRSWEFLPLCLHSLQPADRLIQSIVNLIRGVGCICRRTKQSIESSLIDDCEMGSSSSTPGEFTEDICIMTTDLYDASSQGSVGYAESGYGSNAATPAPSRLPSSATLSSCTDGDGATCTPALSRLPSFAKSPINTIAEDETTDDSRR